MPTIPSSLNSNSRPTEESGDAPQHAIAVTAGAGSGKTRVLVGRYLHLLEQGHPLRSLVAITFTDKAAREMRTRIRAEIQQRLSESPTDLWQPPSPNSMQRASAPFTACAPKFCARIPSKPRSIRTSSCWKKANRPRGRRRRSKPRWRGPPPDRTPRPSSACSRKAACARFSPR